MSWYTKVAWTEGLFLRPHHFQQNDRYHEHLLESRVRYATPYPWGFTTLEIDRDLAQQSKFALRRASGVMPDGTPFDVPADSPLPASIVVPENASQPIIWLTMPMGSRNMREADAPELAADRSESKIAIPGDGSEEEVRLQLQRTEMKRGFGHVKA